MKKIILTFTISLLFIGLSRAQEPFNEEFIIPLSSPGQVGTLKINLPNGDIRIKSYSGNEVVVNVAQEMGNQEREPERTNASGLKKIPNYSLGFRITEENNLVRINNSRGGYDRKLNIEIQIPQRFNLSLSAHRGNIYVENISGELDVNTHNGEIELSEISGSASANTHNGDIVVSFRSVEANIPMAFTTYNGKVDITFPANIRATAKLRTQRGEIYTDFDMQVERTKVNVDRQSKRYEVSIDAWTLGKINGGGPEYLFKNYSDNIYVRKRK